MATTTTDHLFLRQYYLACLSHASYLVGDRSTGKAVVVDPQRDVAEYLADAAANGFTITHVLETHFHADFLSGHLELQEATGAPIGYGRAAEGRAEFPIVTFAAVWKSSSPASPRSPVMRRPMPRPPASTCRDAKSTCWRVRRSAPPTARSRHP